MNEEVRAERAEAHSTSDGQRKYVLEDVFWVPISNCRHARAVSSALPARCPEDRDTREPSGSGETESASPNNFR